MDGHAYISNGKKCQICGRGPGDPIHLLGLPGLDLKAAEHARNVAQAEELSAELRRPKADITGTARKMEREAPLFFGTGASPSLF